LRPRAPALKLFSRKVKRNGAMAQIEERENKLRFPCAPAPLRLIFPHVHNFSFLIAIFVNSKIS